MPVSKARVYISEPEEIELKGLTPLLTSYSLIEGDAGVERKVTENIEGLVIRSRTVVDAHVLSRLPRLKWILRIGVGLDTIDLLACKQRGILIYNSSGANAESVAEYVVGMMITALRGWQRITQKDLKTFNRYRFMGIELKGKRVGIVGFGAIGRAVFRRLFLWDIKEFLVYDPYIKPQSLFALGVTPVKDVKALVEQAEIITLHVPLTETSYHLIGKDEISGLGEGFILVNAARGAIVDEEALLSVLKEKQGVYIADVFETEPFIRPQFLTHPQVIATPHIAAMTKEAHAEMVKEAVEHFLQGKSIDYSRMGVPIKKGVSDETYQPQV